MDDSPGYDSTTLVLWQVGRTELYTNSSPIGRTARRQLGPGGRTATLALLAQVRRLRTPGGSRKPRVCVPANSNVLTYMYQVANWKLFPDCTSLS